MHSSAPPLSTPHRDGRYNRFFELVKDSAYGSALARVMNIVVTGDVPTKTANMLSSVTFIVLFKKDQAAMKELKRLQGKDHRQPQRSI